MLNRRRGFTLIEILCTVSILAIAAVFSMPLLGNGNANVKLVASTRSIMADLFYAQNLAMSSQEPVYILFSPATGTTGGSYWLLNQNADGVTYTMPDRPGGYRFGVYLGQTTAPVNGFTQLSDAQLGAVQQGGVAIPTVTLAKVSYNGLQWTSVTGALIGFDTFGQPFVGTDATATAGKLSATGTIQLIAPSNNAVTLTLSLEPFTGELTVN
jgi:prepilin-type N-terminal cleavage/methylation domain-containing protein